MNFRVTESPRTLFELPKMRYNTGMENDINNINNLTDIDNTEPVEAEITDTEPAEIEPAESEFADTEPADTDNVDGETCDCPECTGDNSAEAGKKSKGKGIVKEILSWVAVILIALVVGGLIRRFGIMTIQVQMSSMYPTCSSGDKVLINRFVYLVDEPARGDIIVFIVEEGKYGMWIDALPVTNPGEKDYIKRVIAVGGDTVHFDGEGGVYVNGELLDEEYLSDSVLTMPGSSGDTIEVPEGYVFVMGDNRAISVDSRDERVGLIQVSRIKGKVFYRIGPSDSRGSIK